MITPDQSAPSQNPGESVIQTKEGYKKTENLFPHNWKMLRYGHAFDFLSTASNSRADLGADGELKYIHYGDIHTKWDHFIDLKSDTVPYIVTNKSSKYPLLELGDIIMADASEDYEGVGKSIVVKNVQNQQGISGLHTMLLRDRNGLFDHEFKGYIHVIPHVKQRLRELATGLKVYGISKGNLKQIEIPVPPLQEQKAIATALSDVDALIQKLDDLIEKKQNIKKATMQLLLTGKKRLDGFEGEWEERTLGELTFDISSGKSNTNSRNGNYPIYGSTGIIGKNYSYDYEGTKMLVARVGANAGTLYKVDGKFNVSDNTLIVSVQPKTNTDFIKELLREYDLTTLVFGSGQPLITGSQLKKLTLSVPPLSEQNEIASVLKSMDKEISVFKKVMYKYQKIKKAMMQELLTGKTRLV